MDRKTSNKCLRSPTMNFVVPQMLLRTGAKASPNQELVGIASVASLELA
jgi:hypothetical protein